MLLQCGYCGRNVTESGNSVPDAVDSDLRERDGLALQSYVGYDRVMWFIRLDQAVSGRVARTGEAAFVRDASEDADFIEVAPGTRQAIIVPLKRGEDEVLGVLLVESVGVPNLTEDDFALLLRQRIDLHISLAAATSTAATAHRHR